jgi:hypothetical protein
MDCPTVSFACAEVVFGVSLNIDAMVAERRPPRFLLDAERRATTLNGEGRSGGAYTTSSST